MTIQHDFPFDPTNGYTLDRLRAIRGPEEPEGFREFWEENYRLVMSMKPTWFIERELWSPTPGERIYRLRVKNWDNTEFVMTVARPEKSCGGLVVGQGYGNPAVPAVSRNGLTTAFACVRGLGLSQCKDIPWDPMKHVLHGIGSKETYILRGVIADQWMTASVLLDMFPDTADNLNYSGGSMGGGMGALLLPWDKRFKSAYLNVPTFGAEIRFDYQSNGSGEACRQYVLEHPEARKVLAWFDASAAAKYIRIPVCVGAAVFDPVVAPVGQFSVANAIPEKYRTLFVRDVGHFTSTEHDSKLNEQVLAWCEKIFTAEDKMAAAAAWSKN